MLPEVEVLARVALALTRNSADAEDLVQETLVAAFQGLDRFDGAHPRAWLLTIMRNAEAKRHRRRRPVLLRDPEAVEASAWAQRNCDPTQVAASAEQSVVGDDFQAAVARCLAGLSAGHRQVVQLVDLEGLSYAEAAQALGIPVGTVMSRLHRARARIRRQLGEAGLTPRRRWL